MSSFRSGLFWIRAFMWAGVLAVLLCSQPARSAQGRAEPSPSNEKERYYDTKRFYFYVETGHSFILDEHFAGDTHFDTPNGFNDVLGGGGGYNLTDHWGVEIQGHGTEPDLRSSAYGKEEEFSNITVAAALRYRYPLYGGRLVPDRRCGFRTERHKRLSQVSHKGPGG